MNNDPLTSSDVFAAIAIGVALASLALAWFDVLFFSVSL